MSLPEKTAVYKDVSNEREVNMYKYIIIFYDISKTQLCVHFIA
jgi:hypothetical protein